MILTADTPVTINWFADSVDEARQWVQEAEAIGDTCTVDWRDMDVAFHTTIQKAMLLYGYWNDSLTDWIYMDYPGIDNLDGQLQTIWNNLITV